jgi:hypothetical protein
MTMETGEKSGPERGWGAGHQRGGVCFTETYMRPSAAPGSLTAAHEAVKALPPDMI